MNIDSTKIVKETVFVAILLGTITVGQWLTSSDPEYRLMLPVLGVYLLVRIFFFKTKSPSR